MDNNKKYKIGIVGVGPVGQILAVHLQEAGCEVAVCDIDKPKIMLIQKEGIRLEGTVEKQCHFKHTYTNISDLKEFDPDLLIFSIKGYHVPLALEGAGVIIKTESSGQGKPCVISAQNGIDVEQMLAGVFGESNTFRMVVNFAGNQIASNVVKVTFFNPPNFIASINNSRVEIAEDFSELLNITGLQTQVIDSFEILSKVWHKTILNASLSALCGILKFTMKEAMESPDTLEIIEHTITESVEVAKAENIIFGDNFVKSCMGYLQKAGDHYPSLAVDFMNNRQTEIEYINGKIVEYGNKHYIKTPMNLALTNMIKAVSLKNLSKKTDK
ncbi:MAG: 2-dehydropantoate 2-reductase [Bacteroidota bacterium]